MEKLKYIDLFCGIGGFHQALSKLGCECVLACDIDKSCQENYKENYHINVVDDVTKIDPSTIPDFDIICGGFPCQPFSSIGKRQGFEHPTQGTLFFDVLRIIKNKRPKAFILENVEGLVNHENGKTLKVILESLASSVNGKEVSSSDGESLHYHIHWKVMNSQFFGVPQTRKRIFII